MPENPVSRNLISFWPARVRTGPAVINNFFSTDSNIYDSYNGIIKIDHTINAKHSMYARYYGGTGKQAAVVNANAPFLEYFQVAPSRMHNYSVVFNSALSPRVVNNLILGTNYFCRRSPTLTAAPTRSPLA